MKIGLLGNDLFQRFIRGVMIGLTLDLCLIAGLRADPGDPPPFLPSSPVIGPGMIEPTGDPDLFHIPSDPVGAALQFQRELHEALFGGVWGVNSSGLWLEEWPIGLGAITGHNEVMEPFTLDAVLFVEAEPDEAQGDPQIAAWMEQSHFTVATVVGRISSQLAGPYDIYGLCYAFTWVDGIRRIRFIPFGQTGSLDAIAEAISKIASSVMGDNPRQPDGNPGILLPGGGPGPGNPNDAECLQCWTDYNEQLNQELERIAEALRTATEARDAKITAAEAALRQARLNATESCYRDIRLATTGLIFALAACALMPLPFSVICALGSGVLWALAVRDAQWRLSVAISAAEAAYAAAVAAAQATYEQQTRSLVEELLQLNKRLLDERHECLVDHECILD